MASLSHSGLTVDGAVMHYKKTCSFSFLQSRWILLLEKHANFTINRNEKLNNNFLMDRNLYLHTKIAV